VFVGNVQDYGRQEYLTDVLFATITITTITITTASSQDDDDDSASSFLQDDDKSHATGVELCY
jgi:hypothetical protein